MGKTKARSFHSRVLPDPFNGSWPAIKARALRATKRTKFIAVVVAVLIANISGFILPALTHASTVHMLLFWDPSNPNPIPTGWSVITSLNGDSITGKFPMGDSVGNTVIGTTGGAGSRPFSPTAVSGTVSAASVTGGNGNGTTNNNTTEVSTTAASHAVPTVTVGSDSNGDLPAYQSLEIIEYNAGIPTTIPQYAIGMFATSTVPSGFTRFSTLSNSNVIDNHMIEDNTTSVNGGSDTVTNAIGSTCTTCNFTLMSDGGSGGTTEIDEYDTAFLGTAVTNSLPTHTHTVVAGTATSAIPTGAAGNADPPYFQPVLGQAQTSVAVAEVDLTAMFDGDPLGDWIVQSNSGGPYNDAFIRPNSSGTFVGTLAGQANHTNTYSAVSGNAIGTVAGYDLLGVGGTALPAAHTHTLSYTLTTESNIPPYFSVVIAQKVQYTLTAYQWYYDNSAYTPGTNDAWPQGSLNLSQSQGIPNIPAAYDPPTAYQPLRLRIQIQVGPLPLAANAIGFKLQYATGSASADCLSGTWNDVDDSGGSLNRPWTYNTGDGLTDGSTLPSTVIPLSNTPENFYNANATTGTLYTNPHAVAANAYMEYDWDLYDNNAPGATVYYFRVIQDTQSQDTGVILNKYNYCPSVNTMAGTSQEMHHGDFFEGGTQQGFEWAN